MEVWGGNQLADSGVSMAGLDAWVFSRPYGNSVGGGDVYYVSSCATGRITRLLIADVSGHGDAVATIAAKLRALMRRYVNHIDQKRFVRSMNNEFVALSDAGTFATAVVTTFFAPTSQLSLCNAGHPPPLVYRADRKTWEFLDPTAATPGEGGNIPLGIVDLDDYCQFNVKLRVNDLVLCYTDSLIEARVGEGELLGTDGLLQIVQSVDPSDPTTFTARLLAAIEAQLPGSLSADDVTVLLFRPNGLAKRAPFIQRAMAPLKIVGAAIAKPFTGQPIPWPEISWRNLLGLNPRE
jgi:serine phosphatase RsbU (regulator of sigma subunit)